MFTRYWLCPSDQNKVLITINSSRPSIRIDATNKGQIKWFPLTNVVPINSIGIFILRSPSHHRCRWWVGANTTSERDRTVDWNFVFSYDFINNMAWRKNFLSRSASETYNNERWLTYLQTGLPVHFWCSWNRIGHQVRSIDRWSSRSSLVSDNHTRTTSDRHYDFWCQMWCHVRGAGSCDVVKGG